MRYFCSAAILAASILAAPLVLHAADLSPASVTVGQHLQASANVVLDEAAPAGDLTITLKSNDPARILLSTSPEGAGSVTIKVTARAGLRGSSDYYVHGLGKSGDATYTATAPGYKSGDGTVTLAPSGVIFGRSGIGVPSLQVTTGTGTVDLNIYTAVLDSSLNYLRPQPVAGGLSVKAELRSSNRRVGAVTPSPVTIAGGLGSAPVQFQPLSAGTTALLLSVPHGLSAPAQFTTVPATVSVPGMAVTDELSIGQNLQVHAVVSLGEPAPTAGTVVTLTTNDKSKLLLSASPVNVGSDSITVSIPAGGVRGEYYLQALGNSGDVSYLATAPGYRARKGKVTLTPSGLVLGGPAGPPDEAELLRKDAAEGPHGFVSSLSAGASTVVTAYTVQLDPTTRRGADLTVQQVRAGVSLKAILKNSNPPVGGVKAAELAIPGGSSSATTHFTPLSLGTTVISVDTPPGFTTASNSTALSVIVKE